MSQIKYFDFSGEEFKEIELTNQPEYHKAEFRSNGLFKKIETLENGIVTNLQIFIESETEIDYFFDKYSHLQSIECALFIEKNENYSNYEYFQINQHNIKSNIGNEVYGKELFPIYQNRKFDREPKNKHLFKYFYFYDLNVEFEFEYESNGEFKRLYIYDVYIIIDSDNNIIYPDNVGIGKNDYNFNWDGMDYYKNAEPILPEKKITTHNTVYN